MRLIDADAFKKRFCDRCNDILGNEPCFDTDCFFQDLLNEIPTIEAEPVRHGEYVLLYDTYGPMVCSECGGEAPSISMGSEYEESQYCPSCGAKMDGKEKKE